jgi:3-methyl-2-oxobutanoate hydroxymethyltransferase
MRREERDLGRAHHRRPAAHEGGAAQDRDAIGGYAGGAVLPYKIIRNDALALQEAGAFAVILTGITPEQAARITQELEIPTIAGYGAGDGTDGQIAVTTGRLGWTADSIDNPRSKYPSVARTIYEGATAFVNDVRSGVPVRAAR